MQGRARVGRCECSVCLAPGPWVLGPTVHVFIARCQTRRWQCSCAGPDLPLLALPQVASDEERKQLFEEYLEKLTVGGC